MPSNGGNITFGIDFNVNKSGLNDLKKSLQDVQKMTTKDLVGNLGSNNQAKKALEDAKRSAAELEQALKRAYNPTLNTTNVSKFNQELKNSGTNLNQVYQNLSKVQGGSSVFRNVATEVLTTNMQLKQTNSLLDSMGKTMINTVKWGIASSVMNSFTGSIQNAYNYIKVLDSSLTDIRIVTGDSRAEMDQFAKSANQAAQALGRQTKEYTNAALAFYQQGLGDEEVAARTETTLKAANITGADVASIADQLTAVWNGFQVQGEKTNEVVSKLAAVADTSASNMSELATAMSKSASVANNMGVNVDQLGAQIATIIATTRQAPQTVGNALKTIYARINDIKAGTDQAEVSLGNYTGKMAQLGINVLDQNGQLRDTGQVMEEIGQRWGTMTKEQQVYLAQTMAGQRQMNNLIALFDNWDMYTKELNISLEAQGTLDQKNARYMESLAAHTKEFQAAQEGLIQAFANGDSFKGFIDLGTQALNLLTKMVDSIGGGGNAILAFGSILTRVFSKQIASQLSTIVLNMEALRENASKLAAQKQITDLFKDVKLNENLSQEFIDLKSHVLDLGSAVTTEQHETINSLLRQRNQLQNQKQAWEADKKAAIDFYEKQRGEKIDLDDPHLKLVQIQRDLKDVQKQATGASRQADNFVVSLQKTVDATKVNTSLQTEMSGYLKIVQQLVQDNKLSAQSTDILTESLNKYNEAITYAKQHGVSGNALFNVTEVKSAAQQLVSNISYSYQEIQDGAVRTSQTLKQNADGTTVKIQNDIDKVKGDLKTLYHEIDTKAAVQGFLKLASSIGQVAFAAKAISNTLKTLKDDSIPPAERALEVIMGLSTSLPMLKSGLTGVLQSVKSLGVAFGVAGAQGTSLLAGFGATLAAAAPLIAVLGLVAGATYALIKAYNKEADEAKKASKILQKRKQQYEDIKKSYDQLKEAIEDYQAQKQALDKLTQGTKAWKEQVDELNQKVLNLVKQYPQLADKVKIVNGAFELSDQTLKEIEENQEKLVKAAQVGALSAQVQANKASTQSQITDVRRGLLYNRKSYKQDDFAAGAQQLVPVSEEIIQTLLDRFKQDSSIFDSRENLQEALGSYAEGQDDLVEVLWENVTDLRSLADSIEKNTQVNDLLSQKIIASQLSESDNKAYQNFEYKDLVNQLLVPVRDAAIEAAKENLNKNPGLYLSEKYIKENDNITSGSYNFVTGKGSYITTNGQTEQRSKEELIDFFAVQQAGQIANEKIDTLMSQITSAIDMANSISEKAGNILADFATNQENIDLTKYTQEEIQAFQQALENNPDLTNVAIALGIENATNLTKVFDGVVNEYFEGLPQQMSQQISNAFEEAKANLASFTNFKEDLLSGKQLQGEDLDEYLGLLTSIGEKYPALRSEIELLKETQMSETEAYKYALEDIGQALQKIKIETAQAAEEDLINNFSESIKGLGQQYDDKGFKINVDVEAQIDQFQRQLDEIQNADYQTLVSVKADLDSDFDRVLGQMDAISDAAGMIGQNFIVAGDDLRELNNAFPGILDGIQYLSDGTARLAEESVANATAAAGQEVGIQAQKVAEKIKIQQQEFYAKAAAAQKISDLAGQLANSETMSESEKSEKISQINNQLNTLKTTNSKNATDTQIQHLDAQANAADIDSEQGAKSAASMYDSAAKNSEEYANQAIANISAVTAAMGGAEGGSGSYSPITSHYTSSGGGIAAGSVSLDTFEAEQFSADTSGEQWQAISEKYAALAQSYLDAANDMNGQLAELSSGISDIGDRVGNAAEGLGGTNTKSGGKGGGGGGGGKDKTKSAEEIDKLKLKDQDVDKYHQIERAIKRIDDYLDEMSGYEEKTIRQGKSDTIDKQVDALEQQKALYEQKIQMMQADLQLQQADLSLLGVQFDEQGNIINYTALMSAYQAQYNALLEQAKLLTGDAQEAKLTQASNLKERLEALKSQMGAYEALQDKIMDAGSAIRDIIDKEEELRIKQFKIEIDTQLDFADAKRDWNEFKKEVIDKIKDDDFLGQARARVQDFFSYYDDQGNGIIQQLTEHVNRTREEAEIIENGGTSSIYGKNQAQALEDLKHYTDELMQNLKDVQEIAEDIHDLYLDTIDKAQDAFDEQIDQYEQIDGIIEHDMNLLELLSPENNEEALAHYYDKRAQNHNQEIDFYRKEADMWKAQLENAEEGTEEWKKFRDNWEASINDLNSAVESAVENLISKYENTISKIIKETKNQIMGGDWQKAMDEWDRAKWNDDRYLDMGSRATGVLDFMDKVNEAMNGQSPKVQKQLNEFLEKEVGYLNEIPNLRQIDLDIAYKKLEVLQKQMALEDAQEAKTRMRLRRDSQGNYTYQYVADEDQIATKQQQLRDTLEELRQLAKVDISDTMDEVQEKLDEFFEHAQELSQTYYDDQDLLQQKLLELQNEYFGEEGYITLLGMDYHTMQEQLLTATGAQFSVLLGQMGNELQAFLGLDGESASDQAVWTSILALLSPDGGKIPTLFDAFVKDVYLKNFALMSEQNQNLLFGSETGLNPSWNTAIGNMAENYIALTRDVVIPCMQAMIDANAVYANDLNILQQVAGVSFGTIAQGIDADIAYTQGLIQANDYLIDTYNAQMNAIAGVCAQIANLCAQYSMAEQAAIDAANAALKFWFAANGQTIGDYYSGGTPHATAAAPASAPVATASSGGSGGGGTPRSDGGGVSAGGGQYFMVKGAGGKATFYEYKGDGNFNASTSKQVDASIAMNGSIVDRNAYAAGNYSQVGGMNSSIYQSKSSGGSGDTSGRYEYDPTHTYKKRISGIQRYATGGYTGDWSNGEGRLALLDQKELVLNAEDTVNMLNAVKIASGMMEKIAGLNSSVLDNLVANRGLSNIETGGTVDSSSHQVINIQADFPNANSADEIRQAFNNLINIASQRASGNRRTY